MRSILLCFDSLNRHFLPAYGNDWVHAPNFSRLARRCAQFERAYVGSMPCMPARRELHTGRPNFLHSPWGALDVYDFSSVEALREAGVHTHLASDHYHYWEENACTYHTKYSTWEFYRGQEGDPWIPQVAEPEQPVHINGKGRRQDWVNRPCIYHEEDAPTPQTIRAGIEYLEMNAAEENWHLQVECFDPHEPFFVHRKYKDLYPEHFEEYDGPEFDWPPYERVSEQTPEQVEHLRYNYAATLSQADAALGDFLDTMDRLEMWEDTMLIVWTDHGHFLGEKGHFAKNYMPWWEELSHIPLWIWDPRVPECAGTKRNAFVQTIDLAPTLLDYHGVDWPETVTGAPLNEVMKSDTGGRKCGIFGNFGNHVAVTDGRLVYYRATERAEVPLYQYTLLPVGLRRSLRKGNPVAIELVDPLPFTQGQRVLRIPAGGHGGRAYGTLLYDLREDPQQEHPIDGNEALEKRAVEMLVTELKRSDAPAEQFDRLGLA